VDAPPLPVPIQLEDSDVNNGIKRLNLSPDDLAFPRLRSKLEVDHDPRSARIQGSFQLFLRGLPVGHGGSGYLPPSRASALPRYPVAIPLSSAAFIPRYLLSLSSSRGGHPAISSSFLQSPRWTTRLGMVMRVHARQTFCLALRSPVLLTGVRSGQMNWLSLR
jgi:hypothetical protein